MLPIDVIVPRFNPRQWQSVAIERLRADGHDVAVLHQPGSERWPTAANAAFAFEQRLFRRRRPNLGAPLREIQARPASRPAALRLDLAGNAAMSEVPTVGLLFDGSRSDLAAATALAAGRLLVRSLVSWPRPRRQPGAPAPAQRAAQ